MRGRRRDAESGRDDSNPLHDATWLYSYADLMTQLLIFSILMLAVLGLKKPQEKPKAADDLAKTREQVERFVKESGLADSMAVDRGANRLVIRMKSAILFGEGQASLTGKAQDVLAGLSPVLAGAPSLLRVEGHTDDVPIRSGQYPSNWELSTARATSVTRYLEEHGVARERLSVAGYGEFHPLVPNDSGERRALNRRVEIVVLGG